MGWISLPRTDATSRAIRGTPRRIKCPDHTFVFILVKASVGRGRLASICIGFRRFMIILILVLMLLGGISIRIIGMLILADILGFRCLLRR